MKIDQEPKLDFDDVLILPQRTTLSSRKEVDITREFKFYHSPKVLNCTPVMCANMSFASFALARELARHKMITCLHKYHKLDELINFFNTFPRFKEYVWVSIGYKKSDLDFVMKLKEAVGDINICVDVPNGQMDCFVDYCKEVRNRSKQSIIMAGNVTDPASTQELIIHGGVDIAKTQIGPGSACETRRVTGVGYPTLSCIIDNSYVAHGLKNGDKKLGLICSDGGIVYSGDVCKAFCGGADFVMMGGYWAGSESCNGQWNDDGTFTYYGMSTHKSQQDHAEGKKNYRASEGTAITVPNKGPIDDLVQELLGGIRSCCAYIGSDSIRSMNKCASFCRVNKIHNNQNPKFGI